MAEAQLRLDPGNEAIGSDSKLPPPHNSIGEVMLIVLNRESG